MEENLKEYSHLKRRLESILHEIKRLNLRKGSETSLKKEKTVKKEKVNQYILLNIGTSNSKTQIVIFQL